MQASKEWRPRIWTAVRVLLLGTLVWGTLLQVCAAETQTCDPRAFGAKADGTTKDTKAIQAAIDACAEKGGGIVQLAGGTFLTAPIVLKSEITMRIEAGATMLGSPDKEDYPERTEFRAPGRQSLIRAENAANLAIEGGGTIDGNGAAWWTRAQQVKNTKAAELFIRPRLVVFDHCRHILLEGVTFQNSPMWHIVPYYSQDVTIRNVKIKAPGDSPNTDGIDPFSSSQVVIDHVLVDVGDDNIAIKSGQPGSPGPDDPSSGIIITDSTFLHGHGLSIGSELAGGVHDVKAERIQFKGTAAGVRIKSNRDRGNNVGNLEYSDLKMQDVGRAILITEYYPKIPRDDNARPVTRLTPHFHDISISNLNASGGNSAGALAGLPESPLTGIRLKNVHIAAVTGLEISNARVLGEKLVVLPKVGPPVSFGQNGKLDSK
jgi:polygalacturonase